MQSEKNNNTSLTELFQRWTEIIWKHASKLQSTLKQKANHVRTVQVTMRKLLCKYHEGRAGFFSLVTVPSKASCSQREIKNSLLPKELWLGERKRPMFVLRGQCCSSHLWGAEPRGAMEERRLSQEELASNSISRWNFSWRHTAAAELREMTEVFWTYSPAGGWDESERNRGQVVQAEGKGDGMSRSKREVMIQGYSLNPLLGWKFSTNVTATGYRYSLMKRYVLERG